MFEEYQHPTRLVEEGFSDENVSIFVNETHDPVCTVIAWMFCVVLFVLIIVGLVV